MEERASRAWLDHPRHGAGGTHPAPPLSHWHAGFSGPPITCAVVSTTTRPAAISPCKKSRKSESLLGLIVYAPQCPPVELSQTLWNTNWTQSVDCVSASAFSTYCSSVESFVAFFGLGGVRVA